MNAIPETQLLSIASPWEVNTPKEEYYDGYKILIREYDHDFEYEIFDGRPVHWDHGFESEEEALREAKKYLDNI